ncbi:MAG: TonB family protein [Vicinamibacterales bacterium]|jgi:TonB family protein|nr:TonB family protein [Vicinamibacterales bacterium]MDP7478556.1 TonB family protein [Vicinamibacterales bacterium]MDP7692473.1 TonB family protein [Vicinamibacterales bacterium]HJN43357.1 TonB family protein [Vicinamibacterales bacterium]
MRENGFIRRLVAWYRRVRVERDLDDEVRFHIGMRVARNLREGLSRDEAERDANARFGDVREVKAAMREASRSKIARLLKSRSARMAVSTSVVGVVAAGAWLLLSGPSGQVFEIGAEVSSPRVLEGTNPRYTQVAMEAKIQGGIVMTCIVQTDGSCTDVDVVESLDTRYGLDRQAQRALRQWRFEPGMRQGEPVAVLVTVEMTFTLR